MPFKPSLKSLSAAIISLLLLTGVLYIVLNGGRQSIDAAIQGVNYRLGPANTNWIEPETVSIRGTLSKSLKGLRTFTGTIIFENRTLPVPDDSRKITIRFDKNGYGPITYVYSEASSQGDVVPKTYSDGVLFANADFSAVTFLNMRDDTARDGAIGREWNGDDGLMFAGPASTREQAVIIANRLMSSYLANTGDAGSHYVLK